MEETLQHGLDKIIEEKIQKAIDTKSSFLSLYECQFDDIKKVVEKLSCIEGLEEINLSGNNFAGVLDLADFNFGILKKVVLDYNFFTEVIGETNLESLHVSSNIVSKVDITSESLKKLDLSNNALFKADFTKVPNLELCDCSNNNLAKLPETVKITTLRISNNMITKIDNLPTTLNHLDASNNLINSFTPDIFSCRFLDLSHNLLRQLVIKSSHMLKCLYLSHNQLTTFEIPAGVTIFKAKNNRLDSLSTKALYLITLEVDNNMLTKIPDIKVADNFSITGNPVSNSTPVKEERFPGHGHVLGSSGVPSAPYPNVSTSPPSYSQAIQPYEQKQSDYKPFFSKGRYSDTNPNYIVHDLRKVIVI